MKKMVILLCILFLEISYAYEKADAFIVTIYDQSIKVLTPAKFDPNLNIIIENKTLSKVLGRVETDRRGVLTYTAVKSGKFKSVTLNLLKDERVYFIPLSPSFQKVELVLGKKSYEIPPNE